MIRLYAVAMLSLFAVSGCKKEVLPKKVHPDVSLMRHGEISEPFFVNPEFRGGKSVMVAVRRVFPECGHISLTDFWIGSDAENNYARFYVGCEIKGGFEGTYFRYLIFAKKKSAQDWAGARVFDWPDSPNEPFNGPIHLLESKGKELGTEPIKPPQTTIGSSAPRRV